MTKYLKCSYCGKETDSRDSRPWIKVMHMSCRMKMMEEEGWREATTEKDGFWGLIKEEEGETK